MTGYLARGTGCSGTTSVDFGLYCRTPRSCAGSATTAHPIPSATARIDRRARRTVRDVRNAAVKPVSRILFAVASPLRARLWRNDHSSSPGIAAGIKQPTRRLRTGRPQAPPYLVLLRAGFCLPPTLPPARCALTAPFHPYPPTPYGLRRGRPDNLGLRRHCRRRLQRSVALVGPAASRSSPRRSSRSERRRAVYFLCHWSVRLPCPGVIRRTALWSSDFPLPNRLHQRPEAPAVSSGSDRLAWLRRWVF